MRSLLVLAQQVRLDPDPSKFPGGGVLQSLTNGVAGLALIVCVLGLVVGAAVWALGAHSNNFQQTVGGKKAVLVSGAAALLIGAAAPLVNFFFGTGTAVQ